MDAGLYYITYTLVLCKFSQWRVSISGITAIFKVKIV